MNAANGKNSPRMLAEQRLGVFHERANQEHHFVIRIDFAHLRTIPEGTAPVSARVLISEPSRQFPAYNLVMPLGSPIVLEVMYGIP